MTPPGKKPKGKAGFEPRSAVLGGEGGCWEGVGGAVSPQGLPGRQARPRFTECISAAARRSGKEVTFY